MGLSDVVSVENPLRLNGKASAATASPVVQIVNTQQRRRAQRRSCLLLVAFVAVLGTLALYLAGGFREPALQPLPVQPASTRTDLRRAPGAHLRATAV